MNDKSAQNQYKKGSMVLVQPMRYCLSFTEGGIENLTDEESAKVNANIAPKITHHWSEDGFKARVLEVHSIETAVGGEETYLLVKLFGQGRKHFTKRDGEKTKEVWVQQRLVSLCKEQKGKKKK